MGADQVRASSRMNHTSKQTSNSTEAPIAGFRLSPQQQRLWELHQAGAPYRIRASVEIEGALDAARLRHAVRRVAEAHEILRMTFACHHGSRVPFQAVSEAGWVWD